MVGPAPAEEPRYDVETLRKVTRLAEHLRQRHEETFTAREMEQIGGEVGLSPEWIRRALRHVTAARAVSPQARGALSRAWWAGGWTLPFIGILGAEALLPPGPGDLSAVFFFLGWGIYIGGGTLLSYFAGSGAGETREGLPARISRETLIEALFTLQQALEAQRQHRAFLSIDVTGSTEMKQGASELEVEYSFGQLRRWLEGIVAYCGGEMQFAAGDGMMASFAQDEAALRAARMALEGLPRFDAELNRLPRPFRLRCGLTAGEVPLENGAPETRAAQETLRASLG